jgi:hypothetical protein
MFKTAFVALTFLAASAYGQIKPDVAAKLRSAEWTERAEAYRLLTAQKNRSPEEETALVALLLREETPAPGPPPPPPKPDARLDNDHYPASELAEYMDALVNTVMEIADREPQRSDVWPELLAVASYNGSSIMMPLFARHAEQTASYFLAAAKGSVHNLPEIYRAGALVGLAKIISYERDSPAKRSLTSAEL